MRCPTSRPCSTSAPWPRPRASAWSSGPRSRPGSPACWPGTRPTPSTSWSEVHVARLGTGGPACAAQHHRALRGGAVDWRAGGWQRRNAGSGRELLWFPDPVGAADCYRAGLPDPLLLVNALRGVPAGADLERVTSRLAATRRDRLTSRLPMLRRPHPEGTIGAVRAEVRGRVDGRYETVVYGAFDRPGVAAGAVAAVAAVAVVRGEAGLPAGAGGLAASSRARDLLAELAVRGRQGRRLHRLSRLPPGLPGAVTGSRVGAPRRAMSRREGRMALVRENVVT